MYVKTSDGFVYETAMARLIAMADMHLRANGFNHENSIYSRRIKSI